LADLYGGDVFGLHDAIRMNTRMVEAHIPGVYDRVLKERAGIQRLVRDCGEEFNEPERFSYAVRLEEWLGVSCEQQVRQLESVASCSIHDLAGFTRALKEHAERLVARGAVAFKIAIIYRREPTVSSVTRSEAERAFQSVLNKRFAEWIQPSTAWSYRLKPLQDYLIRELCDLAASLAVPVQVHTGLPEGNRLPYTWGDPSAFLGLALDHPSLDLHLLHMGHPFEREACAMAKMYKNVFLDCSWVHQLNQSAATHYLCYALDEVPQWKILGFGGDYAHHEGVYSCLKFARANMVRSLASRVEKGYCNEEDALAAVRLLLHDNAARLLTRPK
jgi:predicted TIM-barrel fold metal-dependent hydrolase